MISGLLRLALLLAVVASTALPAWAGLFNAEEYERKRDEVASLANRGLYAAAEGKFVEVSSNDDYETDAELYLIGARVARATGNVGKLRNRLTIALEKNEDAHTATWLKQVDDEYGPVDVSSKAKELRDLVPSPPPFNPDYAAAISYAKDELLLSGEFEGYLPVGTYLIAGHELNVQPSAEPQRLHLNKKGESKSEPKAVKQVEPTPPAEDEPEAQDEPTEPSEPDQPGEPT